MATEGVRQGSEEAGKSTTGERLDALGWGLFLVMIGGLWLAPAQIPEGTWLIGAAVIILGLAVARYLMAVEVSGFAVILGVLALGAGLGSVLGLEIPVFPILLIIAGVASLLRIVLQRD
jgi:hypothetical protein